MARLLYVAYTLKNTQGGHRLGGMKLVVGNLDWILDSGFSRGWEIQKRPTLDEKVVTLVVNSGQELISVSFFARIVFQLKFCRGNIHENVWILILSLEPENSYHVLEEIRQRPDVDRAFLPSAAKQSSRGSHSESE